MSAGSTPPAGDVRRDTKLRKRALGGAPVDGAAWGHSAKANITEREKLDAAHTERLLQISRARLPLYLHTADSEETDPRMSHSSVVHSLFSLLSHLPVCLTISHLVAL
mmetsp:Transcript_13366/g.28807  ORF Transcript_13366/g.28807 Transcript_13366/m.28807 type:complete len:108 (-) Transcript_13366:214-537(-)